MSKDSKSIEIIFLESLLKISLISICIVIAVDFTYNQFTVQRSLIVNGTVLFAIVTTFILHRQGFFIAAVLWIGFSIMAAMFFQSIQAETITTSSMAVVMIIGFGFSVLLKGRLPWALHFVTILGMVVIFGWLASHPIRYHEQNPGDIIIAGVTYVVLYSVIAYSSKLLKEKYDGALIMLAAKNLELADKAHEIETQNEELQQSQENLFALNSHLEQLVEERTNKIKQQNEQLYRYAYTNAHHLRGPVARILGLIELSKLETDLNYEFLFNRIQEQTIELDGVVREINNALQ